MSDTPHAHAAETVRHNHLTRDPKPKGRCPACDEYYAEMEVFTEAEIKRIKAARSNGSPVPETKTAALPVPCPKCGGRLVADITEGSIGPYVPTVRCLDCSEQFDGSND